MSLIISRISRVSIDVGLLTSIDTGTVMRRPAGDPGHSCETVRHWVVQGEFKPSLDPLGLMIENSLGSSDLPNYRPVGLMSPSDDP